MIGGIDSTGRAMLHIRLRHPISAVETEMCVWIDTGFTGELLIPRQQIEALGFPLGPMVRAGLADGSVVELDTFTCLLEWFGEWKRIEVVANQGQFPLLGIGLLHDHLLTIDYRAKAVTLT